MVIWLGKRYLKKWEQKSNNDVKELMIDKLLENPVAKSLKEIAFKGFKTEKLIIGSKLIEETTGQNSLKFRDIVNFGLTIAEGGGTDLIKQNHYFIHLTFQEFLSAIYLKEQLSSDDSFKEAQNLIINGKGKARYLVLLKFLAGLVNQESGKELERFWDAILRSKDGEIECGGKEEVKFLAHLLSQSLDDEGKVNERIPSEIKQYVDDEIKKNVEYWSKTIKESSYKPGNILSLVKDRLEIDEDDKF